MIDRWILTLPRFVAYTLFVSDSIGQGSKHDFSLFFLSFLLFLFIWGK